MVLYIETIILFINLLGNKKTLDFQILIDSIRNVNKDILSSADIIRTFFVKNQDKFEQFYENIQDQLKNSHKNIRASHRSDHEEWFKGLPKAIITKEEAMVRKSQDRIRGYFYKTKEELTNCKIYRENVRGREIITEILHVFQAFLIGMDYFGSLFDRKCENKHKSVLSIDELDARVTGPPTKKRRQMIVEIFNDSKLKEDYCVSLCNTDGEFRCHGVWNSDSCSYEDHRINPYLSKENAVLFQVWNLDHQIELSRSVLPSLLEAVKLISEEGVLCLKHKKPAIMVSIIKYFREIFTVDNLRLVHIICHDKATHRLESKQVVLCLNCREYKMIKNFVNKINII